jgi:hypothetical protein
LGTTTDGGMAIVAVEGVEFGGDELILLLQHDSGLGVPPRDKPNPTPDPEPLPSEHSRPFSITKRKWCMSFRLGFVHSFLSLDTGTDVVLLLHEISSLH